MIIRQQMEDKEGYRQPKQQVNSLELERERMQTKRMWKYRYERVKTQYLCVRAQSLHMTNEESHLVEEHISYNGGNQHISYSNNASYNVPSSGKVGNERGCPNNLDVVKAK